jgi:hypothetical protein
MLATADKVIEKPIRQFTFGCCDAQSISGSGPKARITATQQQRPVHL